MASKPLKGVGGVLGGLISPEPTIYRNARTGVQHRPGMVAEPAGDEQPAAPGVKARIRHSAHARIHARRGRPPGSKTGEGVDKEKVTLRLSKELMDEYRDWSWDKRCQLGELVEEALSQYRSRRTRQRSE